MAFRTKNLKVGSGALFIALVAFALLAGGNCSILPSKFNGSPSPMGGFFSKFRNSYSLIPMGMFAAGSTDVNDTAWHIVCQVDSRHHRIVMGDSSAAAHILSQAANDNLWLSSQAIPDTNIVAVTTSSRTCFNWPNPIWAFGEYLGIREL